jgi:hypothetical protein
MRPIWVGGVRGAREERERRERTDVRVSRDPASIDNVAFLRCPVRRISQPKSKPPRSRTLSHGNSTLTSAASRSALAAKSSTPR